MQTSSLTSVQKRLQHFSGAELHAIAKAAGVGRSTIYRLRSLQHDEPSTVRDATVAQIEAALSTRAR